jgi:transmembrane sensor
MRKTIDPVLLQRYIENNCTASEAKLVESWVNDPNCEVELIQFMSSHWNQLQNHNGRNTDMTHVLERFMQHMDEPVTSNTKVRKLDQDKGFTLWPRVAAAVSALVVVSMALFLVLKNQSGKPEVDSWQKTVNAFSASNKIKPFQLPDGTQVWLNTRSTLSLSPDFMGEAREVYLDGEAYFDVVEDVNRPFIVHTHDIKVKVLGTAFTVKSYKDDHTSEATLVRGKVQVEQHNLLDKDLMQLSPNEKAIYTRSSHELVKKVVAAEELVQWREGVLKFEEEPIQNVIKALERWYDVKIILTEEQVASCRLTATIDKESIVETLDLLKSTTGIDYSRTEREIVVHGKLCD